MKSNLSAQPDLMAKAIKVAEKGQFTCHPAPMFGACIHTLSTNLPVYRMQSDEQCPLASLLYSITEPITAVYCSSEPSQAAIDALLAKSCPSLYLATLLAPDDDTWIKQLSEQGVQIEIGLLEAQAKALNHDYLFCREHQRPFVRLKLAASLDGRTALKNGQSKWITGPQARQDVQTFRAQSGAILSGSGTVMADNPSLNVRWQDCLALQQTLPEAQVRQPKRIIIDNKHQLNKDYQVFSLPGDTYLVSTERNQNSPGITLQVNKCGQYVDLSDMMQRLSRELGIYSVWVEAGQVLAGALLQARLVDEFILYQAPKLMGHHSRGLLSLPEFNDMSQVLELTISDVCQIGADIRIISRVK